MSSTGDFIKPATDIPPRRVAPFLRKLRRLANAGLSKIIFFIGLADFNIFLPQDKQYYLKRRSTPFKFKNLN
jgi:hypothetical protein